MSVYSYCMGCILVSMVTCCSFPIVLPFGHS